MKICSNLAVNLDKLGRKDKALQILKLVAQKKAFEDEKKLGNNLGVLHQRAGNH